MLFGVSRSGHDGHRNAGDRGIAQLGAAKFAAAQPRHPQIEEDEAGYIGRPMTHRPQQVQGFETVLGGDCVEPLCRQERRQHLTGL